jgi:lactosylceramide 4-alpha-galactosyltransferase
LWKYGGTYLDLDVVLLRPLTGLKNYAGAESKGYIGAGVLNMERGSQLAMDCVDDNRQTFKGSEWCSSGPGVITRVANRLCGVKEVEEMTLEKCLGKFEVRPPYEFYPIPYPSWQLYYDEATANSTMDMLHKSYAVHVWNKLSSQAQVRVGSRQPYGLIAAEHCPKVYFNIGPIF